MSLTEYEERLPYEQKFGVFVHQNLCQLQWVQRTEQQRREGGPTLYTK